MPELPEAEYMVRRLAECATGATITRVAVLREGFAAAGVARHGTGPVSGYGRRAKSVLIHLASGWTLRLALGMTGHVYWIGNARHAPPHTRAVFHLHQRQAIVFEDPRVFGSVEVHRTAQLEEQAFAAYGPEPLAPGFTWRQLAQAASGRRAPLKPFLLDQSRVAGLGNIWAAEALFRAGLLPWRTVDTLGPPEWQQLHRAIRAVLRRAIANTFRVTSSAAEFPEADLLLTAVYGRAGQPCRRCHTPVERQLQAGRATYFCPHCQR